MFQYQGCKLYSLLILRGYLDYKHVHLHLHLPVPRPRKSLSATTTEVSSPPSNTATSDDQQPPPITPRATRSPAKHMTEATRDTRMSNHEASAESSTNNAMTTTRSGRVSRPPERYEPG